MKIECQQVGERQRRHSSSERKTRDVAGEKTSSDPRDSDKISLPRAKGLS